MSLPPGFRFHPTDVELIKYYLKRKSLGKKLRLEAIAEVDVYKYSPWDLPDKSYLKNKDLEWFFFCPVSRKYASGSRLRRATETGFWKSTGKDRTVMYNEQVVGMIKTLIFHLGHAPKGDRTDWVMHEYRILEKELADGGVDQAPYVLVKVFKKNGLGPQNGAQYGAPFNENEWDSDGDVEMCAEAIPSSSTSIPLSAVANHSSVVTNTSIQTNTSAASQLPPVYSSPSASAHNNSRFVVTPTLSESVPLTAETHNYNSVITNSFFQGGSMPVEPLHVPGPSTTTLQANVVMPAVGDEVDLETLLAMFDSDGRPTVPSNSNINQVDGEDYIELDDVYAGLDDLADWEELSQLLN